MNEKRSRIYISGSIEGVGDYRERFADAEEYLISKRFRPVNPAKMDFGDALDREDYLELGLTLIDKCDAVYMLDGWQTSRGANREYGYAKGKDKVILYEEEK